MYGRDEYHHAEAARIEAEVRALVEAADEGTRKVLREKFATAAKVTTLSSLGVDAQRQALAAHAADRRAQGMPPPTTGIIGGILGGILGR